MDTAVNTIELTDVLPERRRAPRQQFITRAMLYRDRRETGAQRITLKDISPEGLGFETASAIEPGTRCRIVVEAGPSRLNWRARVVCCGRIDDDLYRIGCEFVPAERELFNLAEGDLPAGDEQPVLVVQ